MNTYIATLLKQFLPEHDEHKLTITWSRAGGNETGGYIVVTDSTTEKKLAEITVRIYA